MPQIVKLLLIGPQHLLNFHRYKMLCQSNSLRIMPFGTEWPTNYSAWLGGCHVTQLETDSFSSLGCAKSLEEHQGSSVMDSAEC